ncbi:MAG: cache domain-containing protein [Syntrophobacteraceae bacterium]
MVRRSIILSVILLLGLMLSAPRFACASLDEAKAMVEKGEAYFKANGKEKALQAFNDPKGEFVKGDLYLFVYGPNYAVIAHPINPKLIGVNTLNVPDVDGKLWRQEAKSKIEKDGWAQVDYKFKNPVTNKVEEKTSYLKKVGEIVIGCGTYK